MAGAAHETIVHFIRTYPAWFDALLRALGREGLPEGVEPADTSVRMVNPVEVRPDVLFVRGKERGPWAIVEPQRDDDAAKQRRWLVAAAALFNERGVMGDIVVVTHSRAVARWAAEVAVVEGPLGTRLALAPVVVLLTRRFAEALLTTGRPELSVFAAWAAHHQRGQAAVRLVTRALALARRATGGALREAVVGAIFNMLDGEQWEPVRRMIFDLSKLPESSVMRAVREREARTAADVLLRVLAKRGVEVDASTRDRVLACTDRTLLDQWVDRAATATAAADVFGDLPPPKPKAARPAKKPARRARAR